MPEFRTVDAGRAKIRAAVEGEGPLVVMVHGFPERAQDFVEPWMKMAQPALEAARAAGTPFELLDDVCEYETVKLSLRNLRTFPWIAEREADGRLSLHGFRFGIANGVLERLGEDGVFNPV